MQDVATRQPPAPNIPLRVLPRTPAAGPQRVLRSRAGAGLALAALVGLSLLLRWNGQRSFLWIDEGLSVGISSHHLGAISHILAKYDGSPPLYYWLLHGWMRVFGHTELAVHALSLLFALASIPAALWAGRSLYGRRAGWVCAVLAAANPFLTYYGREGRQYAMVAFLSFLAAGAFAQGFVYRRRGHLVLFAASLTALLYTHNWAIYLTIAALLALLPCLLVTDGRRALLVDAALTFGVVAIAYLPWLPTVAYQIRHTGAPWSPVPSLREAVSEVDAVLGDERTLVAILLGGGGALLGLLRPLRERLVATTVALLLLFAVPIAIAWTVSQSEPSWTTRYLAIIVGPLLLVAALALSRGGRQGLFALGLILVFWTHPLARVTGAYPVNLHAKSNVSQVADSLGPSLRPGDLVVATHPEQVPVLHYYLPAGLRYATELGAVRDPTYMDWRDAAKRIKAVSVERQLFPLVERLAPGHRLLLVGPIGRIGHHEAKWIKLFKQRARQWDTALRADTRLHEIAHYRTIHSDVGGTSLYGVLFQKA